MLSFQKWNYTETQWYKKCYNKYFYIHDTTFYICPAGKHLPYGCVEAGQEVGQGFSAIRVRQQTHDDYNYSSASKDLINRRKKKKIEYGNTV